MVEPNPMRVVAVDGGSSFAKASAVALRTSSFAKATADKMADESADKSGRGKARLGIGAGLLLEYRVGL